MWGSLPFFRELSSLPCQAGLLDPLPGTISAPCGHAGGKAAKTRPHKAQKIASTLRQTSLSGHIGKGHGHTFPELETYITSSESNIAVGSYLRTIGHRIPLSVTPARRPPSVHFLNGEVVLPM